MEVGVVSISTRYHYQMGARFAGFSRCRRCCLCCERGRWSVWSLEVSHAGDALEKAYSGVGETVDCVVSYCVVSMLCCLVLSYEKEV